MIRSIARLANDLGIVMIAEGRESAASAHAVAALEISGGQGYHFGRPSQDRSVPHRNGGRSATPRYGARCCRQSQDAPSIAAACPTRTGPALPVVRIRARKT